MAAAIAPLPRLPCAFADLPLSSLWDAQKRAKEVEIHEIRDPDEVGLEVHDQLTELFQWKYGLEQEDYEDEGEE